MASPDTCHAIEPLFNRSSQIAAAIIFLGVRTLCGWGSNFAFSILALMSSCSLTRLVTEIVASVAVLLNLDWCKYQWLWRTLGSFAFAPYFTLIILNIMLTFHRIAYTIFPLYAGQAHVSSMFKVEKIL
uniref:Mannosyltransferase n=1 Tax=Heterorhabditis bacteriophora TaxID=37862 RepID=A0A1I7WQM5_HETBA